MTMTDPEALRARRYHLLEQISQAADEIARIDSRLSFLQNQEVET
jgi:hypothetical protein